mmetsp:Transcript_922/g.2105  ORF Transcript_922/g.2105 Transcript_922/m.2105 type:complete len:215 (-) Transcript_922:1589-2233(-)
MSPCQHSQRIALDGHDCAVPPHRSPHEEASHPLLNDRANLVILRTLHMEGPPPGLDHGGSGILPGAAVLLQLLALVPFTPCLLNLLCGALPEELRMLLAAARGRLLTACGRGELSISSQLPLLPRCHWSLWRPARWRSTVACGGGRRPLCGGGLASGCCRGSFALSTPAIASCLRRIVLLVQRRALPRPLVTCLLPPLPAHDHQRRRVVLRHGV